ncbi:MAG: exodeoxyribonuclease VII large subunit, partial [Gemmatimonadota bacterium]
VWTDLEADVRAHAQALRRALAQKAARARQRFAATTRQVQLAAQRVVERRRARLEAAGGRLEALSPLATLGRGYAVAQATDGTALTSAKAFRDGLDFSLVLRDGRVRATARDVIVTPATGTP